MFSSTFGSEFGKLYGILSRAHREVRSLSVFLSGSTITFIIIPNRKLTVFSDVIKLTNTRHNELMSRLQHDGVKDAASEKFENFFS